MDNSKTYFVHLTHSLNSAFLYSNIDLILNRDSIDWTWTKTVKAIKLSTGWPEIQALKKSKTQKNYLGVVGARGCLVALNTTYAVNNENTVQIMSILNHFKRMLKYNGISQTPHNVTI